MLYELSPPSAARPTFHDRTLRARVYVERSQRKEAQKRLRRTLAALAAGLLCTIGVGFNADALKARAGLALINALPTISTNAGGSALKYEDDQLRIYVHPDHGMFYAERGPDGEWRDAYSHETI